MKLRLLLLSASLLIAQASLAHGGPDPARVARDVARIKALLPAGQELAGAYGAMGEALAGAAYGQAVASSYLFADFNQDGRPDLAVAVEAPPVKDPDGNLIAGARALRVFLADASGRLQPFTQGANVLLKADGGGLQGDPFQGLARTRSGALTVAHAGGSRDRWALTQTFQFRKDGFYLIGQTTTTWDATNPDRGTVVDCNLLTGACLTTRTRAGKQVVTRKKQPVKPLVALADARAEVD